MFEATGIVLGVLIAGCAIFIAFIVALLYSRGV